MMPELESRVESLLEWLRESRDHFLHYHTCGACGYKCGWFVQDGQLYYDCGCYCITALMIEKREDGDILQALEIWPQGIDRLEAQTKPVGLVEDGHWMDNAVRPGGIA